MHEELLNLRPKRVLCPYCGQWHEWESNRSLIDFSFNQPYNMICNTEEKEYQFNSDYCEFYFANSCIFYEGSQLCGRSSIQPHGRIPISSIQESREKPIVTFEISFTTQDIVGREKCKTCDFVKDCNICNLGDLGDHRNITITMGFEFEESEYEKITGINLSEEGRLKEQQEELTRREQTLLEREAQVNSEERRLKEQQEELTRREQTLIERETQVNDREQEISKQLQNMTQQKSKEVSVMEKVSLKKQLLEHSPKENIEKLKQLAERYKPALKWALPVASIYAAYKILNAQTASFNVNNVEEISRENMGFELPFLKDKKALKELLSFGKVLAVSYGATKLFSSAFSFITDPNSKDEVSVEEIENSMNGLEKASKKLDWLRPKAEDMFPVAISVIIVYLTVNPSKNSYVDKVKEKFHSLTEDWAIRLSLFADLAKAFVNDKFGIDLSSEEEQKKFKMFALLAAIGGILLFLYGKKILKSKASTEESEESEGDNEKDVNPKMQAFMKQLVDILKKMIPTVFATITSVLVSKKLLEMDAVEEYSEEEPAKSTDDGSQPTSEEDSKQPAEVSEE